jgi:hypothetical protein
MTIRVSVEQVALLSDGVWSAILNPHEIQMFARTRSAGMGQVSVLGVIEPEFDKAAGTLSIDSRQAYVLNVGKSDRTLIVDLGASPPATEKEQTTASISRPSDSSPDGRGDSMFITSCRYHLGPKLVSMAQQLLSEIRSRYPGELHEGLARKWVNHPENFVALTIQNRDQSFAIHVKGEPEEFTAPTLVIKPDRGSYSRFKLKDEGQLQDAISVILASAKATHRL